MVGATASVFEVFAVDGVGSNGGHSDHSAVPHGGGTGSDDVTGGAFADDWAEFELSEAFGDDLCVTEREGVAHEGGGELQGVASVDVLAELEAELAPRGSDEPRGADEGVEDINGG